MESSIHLTEPAGVQIHVHAQKVSIVNHGIGVAELNAILKKLETIMATIDQVLQDVTDEKTSIAGLSTLIAGLKQQIADALAGVTLPPAVQAKIDSVFAVAEQNKADLATALAANTPPVPTP